jgi:colicin import membrane protein
VDASLRVARLPFDLSTQFVGGAGSSISLAVDRADARARALAGFVLGDAELQDDAARRHAATDERVRALRLREQADDTSDHADRRAEDKEESAARRRVGAASSANRRKAQADERRQAREAEAARAAQRRQRGTERAMAAKQETVQAHADEARLDALEEKAEALEHVEEALIASDEAKRLARAAEAAKAQRKRS